jgi:predicted acylesterase/phospholipase RssA
MSAHNSGDSLYDMTHFLSMGIPSYASSRYIRTREIMAKATSFVAKSKECANWDSKIYRSNDAGKMRGVAESLQLKYQVLGYLEDLTEGEMHSNGLHPDELRLYADWVMADVPRDPFPINAYPKQAFERLHWLREYINNAGGESDREKAKKAVLRAIYLESRPELKLKEVENLVLAGGGAKTLSLAGVIKSLEDGGHEEQIKRVAGTSGGAIIAMAYAAGYTSEELKKVVLDNNFGLFTLNNSTLVKVLRLEQWAYHLKRNDPSSKLHLLSDNSVATHFHKMVFESLAMALKDVDSGLLRRLGEQIGDSNSKSKLSKRLVRVLTQGDVRSRDTLYHQIIKALPDKVKNDIVRDATKSLVEKFGDEERLGGFNLYKDPSSALVNSMRHRTGQDIVLGFFSDVLLEKFKGIPQDFLRKAFRKPGDDRPVTETEMRSITFSQWQSLHEQMPKTIKELHISMSVRRKDGKIFTKAGYDPFEHVDASHQHPVFKDMRVTDAVRVSMNLPPVYSRYKFKVGEREFTGIDGGVKSNFSLDTFDAQFAPEKTVGVFYRTEKQLESATNLERTLVLPRSEEKIREELAFLRQQEASLIEQIKLYDVEYSHLNSDPIDDTPVQAEVRETYTRLIEEKQRNDVQQAFVNRELKHIEDTRVNSLKGWLKRPLDAVGQSFSRYLDQKSNDNLARSHNLRRLVMINTKEVDTWSFKLGDEDKIKQISYGEKAMNSLLNGTYCLENHFYYHHYQSAMKASLANTLSDGGLKSHIQRADAPDSSHLAHPFDAASNWTPRVPGEMNNSGIHHIEPLSEAIHNDAVGLERGRDTDRERRVDDMRAVLHIQPEDALPDKAKQIVSQSVSKRL